MVPLSIHFFLGSSPHTRGALFARGAFPLAVRIIPAYAGSTRDPRSRGGHHGDHPRIRGEHRLSGLYTGDGQGSSPHTRGAPLSRSSARRSTRIIPAYAGSTAETAFAASQSTGSSPHTRGARMDRLGQTPVVRIIPAYAGSTAPRWASPRARPDHPRIRGEHFTHTIRKRRKHGSSPHTRGALYGGPRLTVQGRIIPAYAGSTPRLRGGPRRRPDHPRIRGEHDCVLK